MITCHNERVELTNTSIPTKNYNLLSINNLLWPYGSVNCTYTTDG